MLRPVRVACKMEHSDNTYRAQHRAPKPLQLLDTMLERKSVMRMERKLGGARSLILFLGLLLVGSLGIIAWASAGSFAAARMPGAEMSPADGTEPLPPGATIETLLPNMNFPIA